MFDRGFAQPGLARAGRHLLLGLMLLLPLLASAQSYVGKVCVVSTLTTRDEGPVTPEVRRMEFDVTNLGGTMYALAGGLVVPPGEPVVATGLATVVGNDLYFNTTVTQAHADGWVDTGINRTRLSLATLTGTFYEIGHDYNTITRTYDQNRYSAGTVQLSLSVCPP
jgi:hypothetical protein